jgi:hypothetical protein
MKQVAVSINGHLHAFRWHTRDDVPHVYNAVIERREQGWITMLEAMSLCQRVTLHDLDVVEGPGVRR